MGATDPDNDDTSFTYYIATAPTKGSMAQMDGTPCAAYPCKVASSGMIFSPIKDDNGSPYATFTFYAVDSHGARSTNNATGTISVNAVNDAPVAGYTASSGLENINITVSLNISDIDSPSSSLIMVIATLPAASLGYLTTRAGVVIKSGDKVPLQNLTFVPAAYVSGSSNFSFQAYDGQLYSNLATCTVTVIFVNHPPNCSVSMLSPILITRSSTTNFSLLAVDYDAGETYTFYLMSFIQSDQTGVLTAPSKTISASTGIIGSSASAGTYTPFALTYAVTGSITSTNFTFLVSDGTYNSSQCTVQLVMTDDIPPVADTPSPVTTQEEVMSGNIAMTGTDPDDVRPLRVYIASLPANGVLYNGNTAITQTGYLPAGVYGVTYMPTGYFYGTDSYNYAMTDANGMNSPTQTVNITVTHVNHLPTVSVGNITAQENAPLNITQIFANDVDGDTLTLVLTSAPTNGTFTLLDGTPVTYPAYFSAPFQFVYVPAQNAYGPVNFTFYVTDGTGNTSSITATINVAFVNQAPVAQNSTLNLLENAVATNFTLTVSDVDSPQANLVAVINTLPPSSLGTVTTPDGQAVTVGQLISSPRILTFTPAQYSYGVGALTFTARDEVLFSAGSGTVTLNVTHVNHAPQVLAASTVVATRGVPLTISLYGSDKDNGDFLTFTLTSVNPGNGVLTNSSTGTAITTNNFVFSSGYITSSGATLTPSLYYTAPANAVGDSYANFTFIATDQGGLSSIPFNVTVSIAHDNIPTANPVSTVSVTQDQSSAPITLSGNDTDVADAGSLQVYITVLPSKGVLTVGGVNLTSAPTLVTGPVTYSTNERGQDSFSFVVVDNVNGTSQSQTVPISIVPVNHAPVVTYSGSGVTVPENANYTVNQITTYDQDGDMVTIYIAAPLPTFGALYQYDGTPITAPNTPITDPLNRFIYVPSGADQTNQATNFSFYGSDGTGTANSNSSVVLVPISIIHVDRPPVANPSTVLAPFNTSLVTFTPNVTDSDSLDSALSVTIESLPDSWAILQYNGVPVVVGQVIPYLSANLELNFTSGSYGYTTFTFSASDGMASSTSYGTIGIAINSPVNSPPVASGPDTLTAVRGQPLAISLGAHDNDFLQNFTYTITVASAGGVFTTSTGAVLTPPTFAIDKAQDQNLYVTNAILMFTAPALASGSAYLIVNFTVSDGTNTSNSAGIAIGIAPNNPPTATFSGTVTLFEEGQSSTFTIGGTDPDPADAGDLNVTITALPTKGTLWLVGGGPITTTGGSYANASFFIVGNPLQYGDDTFSYAVVDNLGGTSASLQVPIQITHVNHAPTGGVHIPQGVMNEPLTIQIYGQDVDSDSVLSFYITQLPAVGELRQSDGTVITSASPSSPVLVTSSSGKLTYIPPTDQYGTNISTIAFFVADNSFASNNCSNITYGSISLRQADLPPVAYDSTVPVPDSGSVTIHLNATDPQGYSYVATIVQFPTSGTLYRSDNTPITPSDPTVGSDGIVIFVPVKGSSGQNYTFSYQVTSSTSSLTSNPGSVSLNVYHVYDAPVFTGQTSYSIPENSAAYLSFSATSEASSYQVNILSTTAIGSLIFVNGSHQVDITGQAPFLMNNADSENRAQYIPPANTSGINLVYITIEVVDEHGTSAPINITISVYHINVPPTVVPTTYTMGNDTYNWTSVVTILENTCTAVAWDLYDSDSDRSNLSSIITSLPFRGTLYQYNADGSTGDAITGQVTVFTSTDGFYHVIYCPTADSSGTNFASFSVIGSDNIAYSDRRYVNFRVTHVNQPPKINITQYEWNTTVNSDLIITGVSVSDVDAKIFPIQVTLTLGFDGAPGVVQNATAISLYNDNADLCNTTEESVVCVATADKLNELLTQVGLAGQENSGIYTIFVEVNDLGDGTGIDPKIVSDSLNVTAVPLDAPRKPGNNNVLTATVASAAVVGAAAAAGVYGYLRKRSPPTSTFFGLEHGLANGVINENPLYEGGVVMENSIYRAPTFGMQKL